ncbi:MAG TPA: proteinase inhibitor I4 serpin [Firmicutes bacterium]|nr:proteinase inhibitor I4 serpin [Bacillota bacterium]
MRKWLALLLVLTLLTGCSQSLPPVVKPPGKFIAQAAGIDSYNQFGFNLYQQLRGQENILLSPVSIALALSMAYNGAAGGTQTAMAETLLVEGIDLEQLNQSNKLLIESLQNSDVTVEIANSLWLRQGVPVLPDFVEVNKTYYDAQVSELDFDDAGAVPTINKWVQDHTNDLIEKIIESPIDSATLAFLLNAVYFQGDWSQPFAAAQTRDDIFYAPTGQVTVPFMNKTASFDYLEDKDLQAIRLPYGKGNMAMYIFLPTDLDVFHERLTQEQWAEWRLGFESARGELSLPKFKFEYEQSLNEALTALGMGIAFDDIKADFSKMVEWGEDVFISEVKHKAFIEVDELGTEAAAVTSIEVQLTGRPPAPSFTMKVDRPFFFMIHDQQTDAVLFMGSVYDPS